MRKYYLKKEIKSNKLLRVTMITRPVALNNNTNHDFDWCVAGRSCIQVSYSSSNTGVVCGLWSVVCGLWSDTKSNIRGFISVIVVVIKV